jgi:glycosyltransferase involved in cell wall biosynthesis
MLNKITPLILTFNEAPNIERNLGQLRWARDIVIVDSFSTDDTIDLTQQFPQVRTFQRAFDTHAKQWNFGLKETGIKTQWVLALDADYIITDELIEELEVLSPPNDVSGYNTEFIYCLQGKRLRSGLYPPVTVLYRRVMATYEQDGHTQRLVTKGEVRTLNGRILHDDRKSLSRWFSSQAGYSELEARKLMANNSAGLSLVDRARRWSIVAPPAMLLYCLVVRRGLFDGWAGWHYAFERTVAELMLSLHLIRYRLEHAAGAASSQVNEKKDVGEVESSTKLEIQGTKL